MLGNLNGPTLVVILLIVLLLFGAPKLPGLAKSIGQSMRILKKEVRSDQEESRREDDPTTGPGPAGTAGDPDPKVAPKNDPDQGPTPRV